MRRSSLATALLLLVQADASCLSGSSCAGSSGSGWNCNNMLNGNCCCTNTAYNSGKFCSSASDCTGSIAVASPSSPSACTDRTNGATDRTDGGCSTYTNPNWCGGYDDTDFSSNTMCCACGGGSSSATFATKADLEAAVQLWDSDNAAARSAHGPIAGWGVSAITDMSSLFYNLDAFNEDVSSWDTSSVTDMSWMFSVRAPLARAVPGVHSVPPCTLRAPPPRLSHALAPLSPLCFALHVRRRCHSAGRAGVVRCKQAAHPLRLGGQLGL